MRFTPSMNGRTSEVVRTTVARTLSLKVMLLSAGALFGGCSYSYTAGSAPSHSQSPYATGSGKQVNGARADDSSSNRGKPVKGRKASNDSSTDKPSNADKDEIPTRKKPDNPPPRRAEPKGDADGLRKDRVPKDEEPNVPTRAVPTDKDESPNVPTRAVPTDKDESPNVPTRAVPKDESPNVPTRAVPKDESPNVPTRAVPKDKGPNAPTRAVPSKKVPTRAAPNEDEEPNVPTRAAPTNPSRVAPTRSLDGQATRARTTSSRTRTVVRPTSRTPRTRVAGR